MGLEESILAQLGSALTRAEDDFAKDKKPHYGLSDRCLRALEELSDKSGKATTGFTNIVTAIAIKAALPNVDVRYHQAQIQGQTPRGAGFNFRGVSEKTIYPWLASNHFEHAKSGWQTRTFERPKPYTLDYDENIGDIKDAFLTTYDELEEKNASAKEALRFLVHRQLELREKKRIQIAIPNTNDIVLIVSLFQKHFSAPYKNKGTSRLPVLCFYAIYSVLVKEIDRFDDKELRRLEEHSAADAQTGAVGDVEVANKDGAIFEALEIKHEMEITQKVLEDVKGKLMDKKVDRYYVLTTHKNSDGSHLIADIDQIRQRFGCQVIVNGVIPSINYYLRLLASPASIFPIYAELLVSDKAITHEHREMWNRIVMNA
jgi:DNA (cytosine-5)-methyltransferase 1